MKEIYTREEFNMIKGIQAVLQQKDLQEKLAALCESNKEKMEGGANGE